MLKLNYHIILASNSPRRRELLSGLGLDYEVRTLPGIDESYPETLQGEEIPVYISSQKASAYLDELKENELLITADTIVWLDGRVLGKPSDEEDACQMLRALSGKTHQVITGVTLATTTFSIQHYNSRHVITPYLKLLLGICESVDHPQIVRIVCANSCLLHSLYLTRSRSLQT